MAQKKKTTMRTLPTRNRDWGFFGTWRRGHGASIAETIEAYAKASRALLSRGFTPAQARDLLDAPIGRHMADQIYGESKIAETVDRMLSASVTRAFREGA